MPASTFTPHVLSFETDRIDADKAAVDCAFSKRRAIHKCGNRKLRYDNGTDRHQCPTIHARSCADALDVREGPLDYGLEGGVTSHVFKSTEHLACEDLRSLPYASHQTSTEDDTMAEVPQANVPAPDARPSRCVSNREEPTIFVNRLVWVAYTCALLPGQARNSA